MIRMYAWENWIVTHRSDYIDHVESVRKIGKANHAQKVNHSHDGRRLNRGGHSPSNLSEPA